MLGKLVVLIFAAFFHQIEASMSIKPMERDDANSRKAHQQLIKKASQGRVDIYFVGDSITRRWGATDYPRFLAHWNESFHGWNAANFGWGGDQIENILWRLENGELEGVKPKVFVVLAGTNNIGPHSSVQDAKYLAQGVNALVQTCHKASPDAVTIVMGIFPREDLPNAGPVIEEANRALEALCDGKKVRFLELRDELVNEKNQLKEGYFPDRLHPDLPAYQIWANELKPLFTEMLGPPAKEDLAPPPTGDPRAENRP